MPNIYNALVVKGRDTAGQPINVTCEVQQLLGNNRVRAVAMSATDGLTRGMEVIDTGAPLSVPVGGATLGRIFNVLGEPVDNLGPVDTRITSPIHRSISFKIKQFHRIEYDCMCDSIYYTRNLNEPDYCNCSGYPFLASS